MECRVKKEFDRIKFRNDQIKLKNFYRGEGFLDIQILKYDYTIHDNKIDIVIELYEDFRTVVNEMKVFNNSVYSDEEILNIVGFTKNMPLNYNFLTTKRIQIIDAYAHKGYIYADINFEILDKENKYRKIVYIYIEEKYRVYVKEMNFDSVQSTVRNICELENFIKKGTLYTPSIMYKLQNDIISTGNFKRIDFHAYGVEDFSDSLIIYFRGEEKPSKWILGGILYQFPDKGKLSAGWGHDNVFGNAEKFNITSSILADLDLNNWFDALISYRVPYLFRTQFGYHIETEFNMEHNDLIHRYDFEIKTGISREFNELIINNDYRYKVSIIDTNAAGTPVRFQNANTNSATLGFYYDTRNDPLYPINGFMALFKTEFAGGPLQGYNNYLSYSVDASYAKTFAERATTVLRTAGGVILPYGGSISRDISVDEQYTLGGYSTVRGFMQDSLGPINDIGTRSGKMFININIEERLLIYNAFGITYFFDSGLLYGDFSVPKISDFVLSGGLGLFIKTIIGPVRFDISRPINATGPLQYYLNLGNAF